RRVLFRSLELHLYVAVAGERGELSGDVVLRRARDVLEGAGGEQFVDGTGTGLQRSGLVLGTLHGHADVPELLGDAGEGLADLRLRLGGVVRGLQRLLLRAE